jgi:GAG-pre-integrase domain
VTRKKIGEGCQKNNLYIFKPKMLNLCASIKISNFELWHRRLGHPSFKILNRLFDFSFENFMDCDVCKLAKLTRPPFSLSLSKSNMHFELIHSDV